MTRKDRPPRPEEEFATWLDALVSGQPARHGPPEEPTGDLFGVEATTRGAYRLARETRLSTDERQRLKEEIMATVNHPAARFTLRQLPVWSSNDDERDRDMTVSAWPVRPRVTMRRKFVSIASGVLVAVMLLAIVAGYGVRNDWIPWHDDNQPTRIAAAPAAAIAVTLPNPQNCTTLPLTDAQLQKFYTAPYEERAARLTTKPVDAVEGGRILQLYEQIRDCSVWVNQPDAVTGLLSPHAIQQTYWRFTGMGGMFDTRMSEPNAQPATPALYVPGINASGTPVMNSPFVWQPNISKTDTYFAAIHVDSMVMLQDGRVFAPLDWSNSEGKGLNSPLTGLVFVKIDGQWKLDDWIFGTQILTAAGR